MSVRRSLAWAFSGQLMGFAASFLGSVVVARLLSPHEMGIYAIALAAQGILSVFISFGIGAYIVRETNLQPRMLDTAFTVNAMLSVALGVMMLLASFAGRFLLGDAAAGDVLRVSAFGCLFGIFSFRASAMLQREMQFKTITLIDVSSAVITSASTVAFALQGFSYMSPAYGGLISGVTSTIAYAWIGRRFWGTRFHLEGWRPMAVFGLRIMSVSGMAVLAMRLSELILGRVLGVAALGLFVRASNLSNLIFQNVYGTATRVVFVQLSREFRETGELKSGFLRGFQLITAVMWPFLGGVAILSGPMIHLLYGEKWIGAAVPLSILMIAQMLVLCYGMMWELFVLRDETARQTRYELTRSAIGLAAFSAGTMLGLAGAAAGRIVDACAGLVLYYPHMRRLSGADRGEIPAIYRSGASLTVAALLPALALMIWYDWSPRVPILMVAGAVVLGITLWLALLFAGNHPLRGEIMLLLRKLRPGRAGMA